MICQVCKEDEAVGVASSSLGAISVAYCKVCLATNREPYAVLVGGLIGLKRDEVADWVKPIIKATLEAENKTEGELWDDVELWEKEYLKAMRRN